MRGWCCGVANCKPHARRLSWHLTDTGFPPSWRRAAMAALGHKSLAEAEQPQSRQAGRAGWRWRASMSTGEQPPKPILEAWETGKKRTENQDEGGKDGDPPGGAPCRRRACPVVDCRDGVPRGSPPGLGPKWSGSLCTLDSASTPRTCVRRGGHAGQPAAPSSCHIAGI